MSFLKRYLPISRLRGYGTRVVTVCLLIALLGAGQPVAAADPIKVGIIEYFPPHYETGTLRGEPRGFAIDTFRAVAQQANLNYQFVTYDNWQEALNALERREIDLIPNLGVSDHRQEFALFTTPLETAAVRLFVRSSDYTIKNPDDLEDSVVAVVEANISYRLVQEHKAFPIAYDSLQDALLALLAGKVEGLVFPEPSVNRLVHESGLDNRIRTVGGSLYEVKRAVAVRSDRPELFAKVDAAVRKVIADKSYAEIYQRWYGASSPFISATALFLIAVSIALTSGAFLLWRYRTVTEMERKLSRLKAEQREQILQAQSTEMAAKLRVFFDQSVSFAGIMDLDGTLTDINEASLANSGFTREQVIGKRFWEAPWWRKDPATQEDLQQAAKLAAAGEIYQRELTYCLADDSERLLDFSLSPVRNDAGVIIFLAPTGYDVTERKQAEKAVEFARQTAEHANLAKSEFVANMSHELRTPLSAILGYTEILSTHLKEPDDLVSVEAIQRNGHHLLALLNDILDLSKIEAGKLNIALQETNLSTLINEICALVETRAQANNLGFRVLYQSWIPETVPTDPTRLRQILINLIGNAIKFTEHGEVTLEIRVEQVGTDNARLIFDIRDTGIGIASDQLTAIFNAFEQGDTSMTRRFEGSGLGLNISRRLANLLKGDISVVSEVDRGSTFTLNLPIGSISEDQLIDPPLPGLVIKESPKPMRQLDGQCVLVVDDRDDMRLLVQRLIEHAGAKTITAVNGQDALERFHRANRSRQPIQAVVMDMQMPVMDGFEATRQLRDSGFSGPIIALTAGAMQGERTKCLQAGCDFYLSKPVDGRQLIELLADNMPASHEDSSSTPVHDYRILIVDDSVDASQALSQILNLEGFDTHTAHDGESALAMIEKEVPNAIILDLNLPDVHGFELLTTLRAKPELAQVLMVALTGEDLFDVKAQAPKPGFDHYFNKPANLMEMRSLFAQQVQTKRSVVM